MVETTMINKDNWVRCPECGHKIFKIEQITGKITLEHKCHACKTISKITIGGNDNGEK